MIIQHFGERRRRKCLNFLTQILISKQYLQRSDNALIWPHPMMEVVWVASLMSRMENLEKAMKQSLVHLKEQEKLKNTITSLESEKARLTEGKWAVERSLDNFRNGLSCNVCKSLAKFPWQITPCCCIMLCLECSNRWLMMESSCPPCRAVVVPGNCITVGEIRPIQ